MATEKELNRLEKNIRTKMAKIESGEMTAKSSRIGKNINLMRSFDEVLYNELLEEYKTILDNR